MASCDDVVVKNDSIERRPRMADLTHWRRELKSTLLVHSAIGRALSPQAIQSACRAAGHAWRETFWNPTTTLLTFLFQVLSAEKTLRAGVADLLAQLAALGRTDLPSADPAAYCQARRRLPGQVLVGMLEHLVEQIRNLRQVPQTWLGHRVWIADGSTVSMPDEPELQAAFPQPPAQKKGCGFPVARLVVLFCWATGAIRDLVIDSLHSHELSLFRKLWHHFQPQDVVVCDRAYCAYVDLVRLLEQGVFGVFRLHQRRKADFRSGKRLGRDDQRVVWRRPPQWLASMGLPREQFEQLPETITVRMVRITGTPKGFRSRTIVVVTTLLDPLATPADEIRALYRDRWLAELNLRSIKVQLGMDVLRGQSVDVVAKEIVMHLVAYNLIRLLMWHAAREHGRDLHRLSFTGTLHRLRDCFPLMLRARTRGEGRRLVAQLLQWIAHDEVLERPNRLEPRRRKRRPKEYSLLMKPRAWYHGRLTIGGR
jgi:hypothetical protein